MVLQTVESLVQCATRSSLPDLNVLRRHAKDMAEQIDPGRSAFLDTYGVRSELEYKQQAMRDGQIMYHAHIGMNDMRQTPASSISGLNRIRPTWLQPCSLTRSMHYC